MGGKVVRKWQWRRSCFRWFCVLTQLLLLTECSVRGKSNSSDDNGIDLKEYPPVQLLKHDDKYVVVGNGLVNVTLCTSGGFIRGIQYNGISNLLEDDFEDSNRGYWDVVWASKRRERGIFDRLEKTNFAIIMEDENQIELSFNRTWDSSMDNSPPLNIDKRFVMLRGSYGFYMYSIFERLEGWPEVILYQGRIVFKLEQSLFRYMAVSDERQRIMPTEKDRSRGKVLDYPEAVLLTKPSDSYLKGEVDDKYQYSSDNVDNRVHGWISSNSNVGFWMITPSNEFRSGGPLKQDLSSHTGPITLSMFFSTHYTGETLALNFEDGEPWKKVFGPVFIYLNSGSVNDDPRALWEDAKEQMLIESDAWPYDFPLSNNFPYANQRGMVTGRLLIRDRYINKVLMTANSAFVGLALPGEVGSWQTESKGYQYWTRADDRGYFLIKDIRPGNYSLYAWVPGIMGDYKYGGYIIITPGADLRLKVLFFDPPRIGPTVWEIGIPDRTAAEFYVPDPNPMLTNKLYSILNIDKFRQYGLWSQYSELYPNEDLVYNVGSNNYQTDWFFAQVTRNVGNKTYVPTTWQILFDLDNVDMTGNYTLQIAMASATEAELQVRINDPDSEDPLFTTGLIGRDNAIARHGIHGLYRLYSVNISADLLHKNRNIIFLRQARGSTPWKGILYDYIRLEGPPSKD